MKTNSYDQGLDRNPANYTALSPISFLERSARVYPDRDSLIHGDTRFTWAQTYARCRRLASALIQRGVGAGDTVAV
ncbi:MAG: AMP-binding protein, partial [Polaromonas sp.]